MDDLTEDQIKVLIRDFWKGCYDMEANGKAVVEAASSLLISTILSLCKSEASARGVIDSFYKQCTIALAQRDWNNGKQDV